MSGPRTTLRLVGPECLLYHAHAKVSVGIPSCHSLGSFTRPGPQGDSWFKREINSQSVCACVCVSYSVVSDSATTGLKLFCPCNSPGKSTGVDCHSPLQGIFPNQGSNPGLPHCRQILYHVSQQGGPKNCEWWQQGEKGIPKGTD